jgi:RimJ/RimL family protein N-acetyltransferase
MNDNRITDGTGATNAITTLSSEKKRLENTINGSSNHNGNNDTYAFTIIKKKDNEAMGNIGLFEIQQNNRTASVGILIGEVDEHSKGYGTDAMKCMLNYAFNTLNLNTIMLYVYDFNEKAQKCYEKC